MANDQDLRFIDQVLSGDTDAFDHLILKYQRPLLSVAARITGRPDDAPDLVQMIFIKAFTKLSSFKRLSTFKTWLYAIAINVARNDLRKAKRWGIMQEVDENVVSREVQPDQDAMQKQQRQLLGKAMQGLPPKQKTVLVLRIYQELSFAEIAEIVQTTENSAKVNFHYAAKKLKNLISIEEKE